MGSEELRISEPALKTAPGHINMVDELMLKAGRGGAGNFHAKKDMSTQPQVREVFLQRPTLCPTPTIA